MKCERCGQEITGAHIGSVCMGCVQADTIRRVDEENAEITALEHELNKDAPKEDDVSEEIIWGGGIMNMGKEMFKEDRLTKVYFILALMEMAGMKENWVRNEVMNDMMYIIDNDLDSIWGKNIRVAHEDHDVSMDRVEFATQLYAKHGKTLVTDPNEE